MSDIHDPRRAPVGSAPATTHVTPSPSPRSASAGSVNTPINFPPHPFPGFFSIHTVNTFTMPFPFRLLLIVVMIVIVFPIVAIWGLCANLWDGEFREIVETQEANWFGMISAVSSAWRGAL